MSEVELTERLDQAIDAMLGNPEASPSVEDQEIAGLLSIASELRELPRLEFKARLRSELEGEAMNTASKMKRQTTQPAKIREGAASIEQNLHDAAHYVERGKRYRREQRRVDRG